MARHDEALMVLALVGLGVLMLGSSAGSQGGYFDPNAPAPPPQPGDGSTNTATNPAPTNIGGSMGNMQLSQTGLQFIETQESFSASAYEDPPGSGKYSIAYGHQITGNESSIIGRALDPSSLVTRDEGLQLLQYDTGWAQNAVNSLVAVPLSQGQFDALVDFCFNEGEPAFAGSTLLSVLNTGDYATASQDFSAWIYEHVGGVKKISTALVARRAGEAQLFTA